MESNYNSAEILSGLFKDVFGYEPLNVKRLAGAGSSRIYFRLSGRDGDSAVGAFGADRVENESFVRLTEVFQPVSPELYAVADDGFHYLMEDLGDTALFDFIKNENAEPLIEKSLERLVAIQLIPEERWADSVMSLPFDRRQVMWDLNYFKYEFLKPSGVVFDENALEDDFEHLACTLVKETSAASGFMFRDFQSRNVMIKDGSPRFIDYQGGRKGPVLYDAVSFLWQAKAGLPENLRRRMLDYYANIMVAKSGVDKDLMLAPLDGILLFRNLQVLGAYGFRGLVERKAHFIESIPFALENLRALIERGALSDYPALEKACVEICNDERWRPENPDTLVIKVFSFSYKKGYPEDLTGNGGGFMFDCRAMHNPGRYAEYKQLTGLDAPVIEFLEERGEVQPFTEHALALVEPAADRYLKRGFKSLQIGFGCTGGQHRSVYCAQRVGEALAAKFPAANVVIKHREQGIEKKYN